MVMYRMRMLAMVLLLAVLGGWSVETAQAQDVPAEVQREIQRQGMTVEEARRQAERMGIDLSNPEQAALRARELGIPESQIRRWLQLVEQAQMAQDTTAGLPPSELEVRGDSLREEALQTTLDEQQARRREAIEARDEADAEADSLTYFGYDIFEGVPDAFQPGVMGPVDDAYIVGPEDELRLTLWGAAELNRDLPVDREGRIYIPEVGQFTVAGRRLADLREDLRLWLSQSYAGLVGEPPTVNMDLTLTRLRPIQVFVLGEVAKPGGYVLSSNATVFNALYSVGGPLERGSLRAIDVIRGGRPIATVDLYEYLLKGYADAEVRLQNNDRVMVRPRLKTVAIRGQVRRPAIYELRSGETFEDLLAFAGGLQPEAYARQFQIERIVPFAERTDPSVARKLLDFDLIGALHEGVRVPIEDGDDVTIFSITGRENLAARSRIPVATVVGAVFKPGRYQLADTIRTVRDLIARADGLTGDAYQEKALLTRLQDDLERESIALDLRQVLQGVPTQDLVLRPQDSLLVYSKLELRAERTVTIRGQVRYPGPYEWMDGMTVADLLFQGGGLTDPEFLKDVFLMRADLFRRSLDGRSEEIVPFDLGETLAGGGLADEELRPEDEIQVYSVDVEVIRDRFVNISGAVKDPDEYRFRDNMSLEDLILQAGGFTEDAFLTEVEVSRMRLNGEGGAEERAVSIRVPLLEQPASTPAEAAVSFALSDSSRALRAARGFRLQHRDRVYVRARPDFEEQSVVTVRGEVQFPGEYTLLRDDEQLSEVVRRAGGVLPTGYPQGGRLLRDSAQVIVEMDRAIRGAARADIILAPGDEIIIPPKPNTVAVRGNVGNEGLIKFTPGRRVSYYLKRAGGDLDRTETIYLTQPSGATFRIRRGWFRATPVVEDGASIFVTRKPPRDPGEGLDWSETITDTMAILSSALTIIVLATRLNN